MSDVPSRLRVRVIRAIVRALPGNAGRAYRQNVIELVVELEREHELRWRDVANCAAGGLLLYPRSMINFAIAIGITALALVTLTRFTLSPSSTMLSPTYHSSPTVIAYSIPASPVGPGDATRGCHAVEEPTTVVFSADTPSSRHPLAFPMLGACAPRASRATRSPG